MDKFKRVNISIDKSLAEKFDEFAKNSGFTKSTLIKSFIKADNGKLEGFFVEDKDKNTTYNFKIEENLYDHVAKLAKEHLISVSSVLRIIIAKNILTEEKSAQLIPLLEQRIKHNLETFNILNVKIQDLDRTMELLIKYSLIKSHRGFNFSTIKTFTIKKDIEKLSKKLHLLMGNTMNLFFIANNDVNEIEKNLNDASKLIGKYEVSIQYFETAIEYYDVQNPFYKKKKKVFTSYHEKLMTASIGKYEIIEYLCDLKSPGLITLGTLSGKLCDIRKQNSIMYLGSGAYVCLFYFFIGLSKEIPSDLKSKFKADFDVYDHTFPKEELIEEKIVNLRTENEIISTNLKSLIIKLGFNIQNFKFNFIPIDLIGPKGTFLGMYKLIEEVQKDKKYDVNLIASTETVRDFSKAVALLKSNSQGSIVGSCHIIFDGEETPKIYQMNETKRIDNNLFSVALRKFQHYLVEPHMDRYWLPIVLRPDLRLELDDLFNHEGDTSTYLNRINRKGMYLEVTSLQTHILEDPAGCMTVGFKKAQFLLKKERSAIQKGQMVEYKCSVAITKI